MLSREQIRQCKDIKTVKVPVPEWASPGAPVEEQFVLVRGLTGTENDEFERNLFEAKKKGVKVNMVNMRAKMAIAVCVNEQGEQFFTETDIEWLGKKSAAPLNRIYAKANELNGTTQEDLEELEKNLEKIPVEDSTSG